METANGAVNFHDASPPNHEIELSEVELELAAPRLTDAQRHQRAGIPERRCLFHRPSSLSARRAWTALFPLTVPVGIFRRALISSCSTGRRNFPAATSASSCSSALSAERSEERRVGKECRSRWSP